MSNKLFRCFKIDEQKRLGAAIAKEFIVCPVGKKIDYISLKGYLVIFPYPSAPPRTKNVGALFFAPERIQRWRRQC